MEIIGTALVKIADALSRIADVNYLSYVQRVTTDAQKHEQEQERLNLYRDQCSREAEIHPHRIKFYQGD